MEGEKSKVERRNSILVLFLLFWTLPDIFELITPLEVNELVVDGTIRLALITLAYEIYASTNFTRVYLRNATFWVFIGTVYNFLEYFSIAYILDSPYLSAIILVTRIINVIILVIIVMYLALSFHYKGQRITTKNRPQGRIKLWRR